jgi:hypothetical protein
LVIRSGFVLTFGLEAFAALPVVAAAGVVPPDEAHATKVASIRNDDSIAGKRRIGSPRKHCDEITNASDKREGRQQ